MKFFIVYKLFYPMLKAYHLLVLLEPLMACARVSGYSLPAFLESLKRDNDKKEHETIKM